MGRKFRSTEVSGNVKINDHGQHTQANWFCVNCNGLNKNHYSDCTMPEVYAIPSTAEAPKKKANKSKRKSKRKAKNASAKKYPT